MRSIIVAALRRSRSARCVSAFLPESEVVPTLLTGDTIVGSGEVIVVILSLALLASPQAPCNNEKTAEDDCAADSTDYTTNDGLCGSAQTGTVVGASCVVA